MVVYKSVCVVLFMPTLAFRSTVAQRSFLQYTDFLFLFIYRSVNVILYFCEGWVKLVMKKSKSILDCDSKHRGGKEGLQVCAVWGVYLIAGKIFHIIYESVCEFSVFTDSVVHDVMSSANQQYKANIFFFFLNQDQRWRNLIVLHNHH